jgi:uncharacterized protein
MFMKLSLTPATTGQWALVTGGSSGIGRAHAIELARRGFDVMIVGRSRERLESARVQMEKDYGVTVHPIHLDLGEADSGERLLVAVGDREVGVLVAAAGEGKPGPFVAANIDSFVECVNVKVRTNLVVIHAVARSMSERGRGAILMVTSTGALQGVPALANNAAAEAYLLTLGEALHHELKARGVTLTVLLPGPTDTPGLAAMVPNPANYPRGTSTPEITAAQGIAALERGAVTHIVGSANRAMFTVLPRRVRTRIMTAVITSIISASKRDLTDTTGVARA